MWYYDPNDRTWHLWPTGGTQPQVGDEAYCGHSFNEDCNEASGEGDLGRHRTCMVLYIRSSSQGG